MHAVVVRVGIDDFEAAQTRLWDAVPQSDTPGFVAAYWTRSADSSDALALLVFDSQEAARAVKRTIELDTLSEPGVLTLRGVALREVIEPVDGPKRLAA
jgi:hypothetical protein